MLHIRYNSVLHSCFIWRIVSGQLTKKTHFLHRGDARGKPGEASISSSTVTLMSGPQPQRFVFQHLQLQASRNIWTDRYVLGNLTNWHRFPTNLTNWRMELGVDGCISSTTSAKCKRRCSRSHPQFLVLGLSHMAVQIGHTCQTTAKHHTLSISQFVVIFGIFGSTCNGGFFPYGARFDKKRHVQIDQKPGHRKL